MIRFLSLFFLLLPAPAMALNVVATIKPLHSLAATLMEGSGSSPALLVEGAQSLHSFSLKPSQIAEVNKADAIFMIDPHFELFMEAVLESAPKNINVVIMSKQQNITLLPVRMSNGLEAHHHGHEDEEKTTDLHLWSSPENAKAMLVAMASELIRLDPAQKILYEKNLAHALSRINALDVSLKKRLSKFLDKRFVTFHDATQYFEHAYNLNSAGSITLHPERGTSAKHMSEIQQTIRDTKAACVFREPQFEGKIVSQLLQDTSIKSQMIDPEASQLSPSPELYFKLLESLAASFEACLG